MKSKTKYLYLSYCFYFLISCNFFLWSNQFVDYTNTLRFFALSISIVILFIVSFIMRVPIIDIDSLKHPIVLLSGSSIIISTISLTNAINPIAGLGLLGTAIAGFILMLIVVQLLKQHQCFLQELGQVFTLIVTIILTIGYFYIVAFDFSERWDPYNMISIFANKNLFASALLLLLPFQLIVILRSSIFWKMLAVLTITSSLFFIVILASRAVWVGLFLGICLIASYAFFSFIKIVYSKKLKDSFLFRKKLISVGLFIVFIVSSFVFSDYVYNKDNIRKKIKSSITSLSTPEKEGRIKIWRLSNEMISLNPILGVGTGNWKIVFPSAGLVVHEQGKIHFVRPHNDYIWVLAENGIIGFLCFILIFVIALNQAIRTARRRQNAERKIIFFVIIGLIGYMTISFFSFPKERIVHNIILHILLASIIAKNIPKSSEQPFKYLKSASIITLISLTIVITVISYYQLEGEYYTNKALNIKSESKFENILRQIEMATLDDNTPKEEPVSQNGNEKPPSNRIDLMMEYLPKAQNIFYNADFITPLSWYQGMAYAKKGIHSKAFLEFQKAYELHPNHLHIINNLGAYYVWQNDFKKAIELYEKALDISPNFVDAQLNLLSTHSLMGNNETALELVLKYDFKRQEQRERIKPVLYHLQNKYPEIIPDNVMEVKGWKVDAILKEIQDLKTSTLTN